MSRSVLSDRLAWALVHVGTAICVGGPSSLSSGPTGRNRTA